jgi:hypothetical protein
MHINFHGNLLDDEFAYHLGEVLSVNVVLHTVDISNNPIGPDGAQNLLNVLLQQNDTLSCLGNLEQNVYMGVRIREEMN